MQDTPENPPPKVRKTEHLFKKGVCPNPGGRPRVPEEFKKFQKETYESLAESLQMYGNMPLADLKNIIENPNTKAFQVMYARIVDQAAEGQKEARQILLDRILGKPKETEFGVVAHMDLMDKIPISVLIELARKNKEGAELGINSGANRVIEATSEVVRGPGE